MAVRGPQAPHLLGFRGRGQVHKGIPWTEQGNAGKKEAGNRRKRIEPDVLPTSGFLLHKYFLRKTGWCVIVIYGVRPVTPTLPRRPSTPGGRLFHLCGKCAGYIAAVNTYRQNMRKYRKVPPHFYCDSVYNKSLLFDCLFRYFSIPFIFSKGKPHSLACRTKRLKLATGFSALRL